MSSHPTPIFSPSRDLSVSALAKTIFNAEAPEQYVRTFPAQSLYLALKHNGLGSSTDLLEIASIEQCRIFLDFDLWEKDQFVEANFWEWLALADEEDDLKHLARLLKFIDLKIVALIIARHTDIKIVEEKTDQPPGPGYYTPDRGATWIFIAAEDATRHFLLARFLAYIYERSPELFYQLISVSSVQTQSMLEEESYNERNKRLAAEGIPEPEQAGTMHAPFSSDEARRLLAQHEVHESISDIRAVEPLVYHSTEIEPLRTLLSEILSNEDFQSELTLIVNAALVYFNVTAHEEKEVFKLVASVKGMLNIGLELAAGMAPQQSLKDIYAPLGAKLLYRLGVTRILRLRRLAHKISETSLQNRSDATGAILALSAAKRALPEIPAALKADGTFETPDGTISVECKPIETMTELDSVMKVLGVGDTAATAQ